MKVFRMPDEGVQGPEAVLEGSQRGLIKVRSKPWATTGRDIHSTE